MSEDLDDANLSREHDRGLVSGLAHDVALCFAHLIANFQSWWSANRSPQAIPEVHPFPLASHPLSSEG